MPLMHANFSRKADCASVQKREFTATDEKSVTGNAQDALKKCTRCTHIS